MSASIARRGVCKACRPLETSTDIVSASTARAEPSDARSENDHPGRSWHTSQNRQAPPDTPSPARSRSARSGQPGASGTPAVQPLVRDTHAQVERYPFVTQTHDRGCTADGPIRMIVFEKSIVSRSRATYIQRSMIRAPQCCPQVDTSGCGTHSSLPPSQERPS